jgi:hypothetical protein
MSVQQERFWRLFCTLLSMKACIHFQHRIFGMMRRAS